jgi:hypothetical protein
MKIHLLLFQFLFTLLFIFVFPIYFAMSAEIASDAHVKTDSNTLWNKQDNHHRHNFRIEKQDHAEIYKKYFTLTDDFSYPAIHTMQ